MGLTSDVEAGLVAGEVLRRNPNWARLGTLVSSADMTELEAYVEIMRRYRAAPSKFDFSAACVELGLR